MAAGANAMLARISMSIEPKAVLHVSRPIVQESMEWPRLYPSLADLFGHSGTSADRLRWFYATDMGPPVLSSQVTTILEVFL